MSKRPFDDAVALRLVESAPDALLLVSDEGQIVFVNAQGEALFGYPRAELIGQPLEVLVPSAQRAIHAEKRAKFAAAPQLRPMGAGLPLSCRRRDGTELPVEVSLSPVRTQDGNFIAAAVRDVSAQQRAQKELHDAEELFRLTFEEAPIGMALVGLDGRFLRVNRSAGQLIGYTPEEMMGLTVQAITHPDDVDMDLALAAQLERGEIPRYKLAKRNIHKDGRVIDVVVSRSLVRDSHARPLHYITQVEDVTEHKRAEEALRRSEESLARAQRVAHLGSWDWDLRTNEMSRSAELYDIFGIRPEPKYSQPRALSRFLHPDDHEKIAAVFKAALQEGRGFQIEYRILREDGSERILFSQGEVMKEQGRPIRLVGTVMDITERKGLEQAREASLRWLSAVLDQCPAAMMLVHGAHGERIEVNQRARALLGSADDGTRHNSDLVLFQSEALPLAPESHPIARALRGERLERLELSLRNRRGQFVPILLDAEPILDKEGAVLGAVIVLEDISILRQLDRLRAEWNSVVAHDLRQPLNTITLTAQLLARKKATAPELAQPTEKIISSALRMNRMINDLLDLSRLEVRKLALSRQPIDLPLLVRTSVERIALEDPDRRCEVRVLSEIPMVNVDADRIAQVMDNLLSNAFKYGTPETPIEIEVKSNGAEVAVAVTNAGSGIAADELPHLFQRFHRTDDAKRGPIKGIGLGLHIVQQLIEAHGGHIKAESTPGEKTTFRFTIPTTEPISAALE